MHFILHENTVSQNFNILVATLLVVDLQQEQSVHPGKSTRFENGFVFPCSQAPDVFGHCIDD
jgi:hypothetical protein